MKIEIKYIITEFILRKQFIYIIENFYYSKYQIQNIYY